MKSGSRWAQPLLPHGIFTLPSAWLVCTWPPRKCSSPVWIKKQSYATRLPTEWACILHLMTFLPPGTPGRKLKITRKTMSSKHRSEDPYGKKKSWGGGGRELEGAERQSPSGLHNTSTQGLCCWPKNNIASQALKHQPPAQRASQAMRPQQSHRVTWTCVLPWDGSTQVITAISTVMTPIAMYHSKMEQPQERFLS